MMPADDFERMVVEAGHQGQVFEVTRDGQPVAVMLGWGEWQAMTMMVEGDR